jgi:anti-sigma-K factor RskA
MECVLAIGAGIYGWSLRTQVQSLRQTVTAASAQIASLRTDLATARRDAATLKTTIRVLSAPDLIQVNLKGQSSAPNAIARGFWSRSHGIVFQTDGLPGLDLSKVYQLWVIKDGKPGSLGTFRVDASGAGMFTVDASLVPEPPQTLAVSLERAGGVPAPEGPIVLMGSTK